MTARNVTLRTGAQAPEPSVRVVNIALDKLMDVNPIALYEAIEMAGDKAHVPFGNTGSVLEEIGLLEAGRMHGVTRDVILASAAIDGDEIRLVSPYAEEATA